MENVEITVVGWDKHQQKRSDQFKNHWFKMSDDFYDNPKTFGLKSDEINLFIFLLCMCSKSSKNTIKLSYEFISSRLRLKTADINRALAKIESKQLITRSVYDRKPSVYLDNKREEDIREEKNIDHFLNFEEIYKIYPKKVGKSKGIERCQSEIKTQEDYDSLSIAVRKYSDYHREKKTEAQFIKHFSTFMSEWRDWVDPQAGTSERFADQEKSIREILEGT